MLELVWVRHGALPPDVQKTYYGFTDHLLSEEGEAQACRAGEKLRGEVFDDVYASPLSRAQRTAALLLDSAGIKRAVQLDERLMEINCGEHEGLEFDRLPAENPRLARALEEDWINARFPGGESAGDVFARVKSFCDELLRGRTDGKVLIIAHGGSIRMALCALLELPPQTFWRVQTHYCGITRFIVQDGFCRLSGFNQ